ncbi:MAG: response regulator [Candidatus Scalindua sp.]|nr:response regulator [Candidatus Scalindua sp.]
MKKKKILIVDDERDMLTVLEKWLIVKGFDVVSAVNGTDAIQLAHSHKPDLIVLDICLPDIDGGEVAKMIKESPETENIPIIFLTALLSKDEEKKNSQVTGGNVMLAKPYSINEILTVIKTHTEKKVLSRNMSN